MTSEQFQSRVRGGAASVLSVSVILAGMTMMNDRVRDQVQAFIAGGGASPELSSSAGRAETMLWVAIDALRDQSIAHAPLTIFALAATVLLLVMLRT